MLAFSLTLFGLAGLLWWRALVVAGDRTDTMAQRMSRFRSEVYGLLIIGPGIAAILRRLDVSQTIWLPVAIGLLAIAGFVVLKVRKIWRAGDAFLIQRGAGYSVAIVEEVEGAGDEATLKLRIFPEAISARPPEVHLEDLIAQQRAGQVRSDRISASALNDFNSKRLAFAHELPAELGGLKPA